MSNPHILIVATSSATMPPSGKPTGLWLEELIIPYYAFKDADADVTIASVQGGAIPVDLRSLEGEARETPAVLRYLKDAALQRMVDATPRFDELDPAQFDAAFLPGGHGTMFDLPGSAALARLVAGYHAQGKIVAAVCHGPAGLVSAVDASGVPIVSGKRVAGFTNSEERAVQLDKDVPFLLEDRLRELGARFERGDDFAPFAIRDGNLVTGQNPASSEKTASLVLEALRTECRAA